MKNGAPTDTMYKIACAIHRLFTHGCRFKSITKLKRVILAQDFVVRALLGNLGRSLFVQVFFFEREGAGGGKTN